MVGPVRLWIVALVAVTLVLVAIAASRFAATGERPLLPLSGAALAFAGVFVLGEAGGYFRPQRATVLAGLSLLVALALVGLWYRER